MNQKFKNTTLNDLAVMVKRGFDDADKKLDEFRKENKQEHKEIHKRLDNIELLLSIKYQRRIEVLEKKVSRLEELLAVR